MWELLDEAAIALIADTRHDPRRHRRHEPAQDGRRVVDQRNDRDRGPARRHVACVRRRADSEMRYGMETSKGLYNSEARAKIERRRVELNEAMARIFDPVDGVDFVITASNPDVAFDADGPLPSVFGGVEAGARNNGRLTFPANLYGNPAISIPAGTLDGLPIGLQVVGRHFSEELLLDLALSVERARPWPLVAPGSPR